MKSKLAACTLVMAMLLSVVTVLILPAGAAATYYSIGFGSNEDLKSWAASEHWPGNGTSDDPIIISGVSIGEEYSASAVELTGIDLHLVIENCSLTGSYYGITLLDCSNVTIRNSTVVSNDLSVSMVGSVNNTVINNTFPEWTGGIELSSSSDDNLIVGNNIHGPHFVFSLDQSCHRNMVASNTILDSNEIAIEDYGHEDVIANNTLAGSFTGIYVYGMGTNTRVENNYITCTGQHSFRGGIWVDSTDVRLVGNDLQGCYIRFSTVPEKNTRQSIDSFTIDSNTVNGRPVHFFRNQDMLGASLPMDGGEHILMNVTNANVRSVSISGEVVVIGSSFITFEDVSINNVFAAASIYYSNNCSIINSEFINNSRCGAEVIGCSDILLSNNSFVGWSGNSLGTEICWSSNTTIENNQFRDLSWAVDLYLVQWGVIVRNNTIEEGNFGITMRESSNAVIEKNIISRTMNGMTVEWGSYSNVLKENKVFDTDQYGILVDHTNNNTVVRNVISGCLDYGIYVLYSEGGNVFYENYISGNNGATFDHDAGHVQAYDNSTDRWSFEGTGNYWADWRSPDENGDGIVDSPYVLDDAGTQDSYPMVVDLAPAEPTVNINIIWPGNGSDLTSGSLAASWSGSSDPGISNYWISVDSGPWTGVGLNTTYDIGSLADGEHIFEVRALDRSGSWNQVSSTFTVDTIAPTIVTKGPMGNRADVYARIGAMFSEDMDEDATTISISNIAGITFWDGKTVILTPPSSLAYGTSYTVTVSGKDLAGNVVEESWTFTTLENKGSISGIALDPSGSPLADATVTLSNGMTMMTNGTGFFRFDGVTSGTYTVTIVKGDYTKVVENVSTTAGSSTEIGTVIVQGTAQMTDVTLLALAGAAVTAVLVTGFLAFWRKKG